MTIPMPAIYLLTNTPVAPQSPTVGKATGITGQIKMRSSSFENIPMDWIAVGDHGEGGMGAMGNESPTRT